MAIARDASDAQHLASTHVQLDVLQVHTKGVVAQHGQALNLQHTRTLRACTRGQGGWLSTNHEARQISVARDAGVAVTRDLAAAQHGAGVAQRANFMQRVADVQNAATLRRQAAQHGKQFVGTLRCEHRGGLVQNQNFRLGEQGANQLDALHLAHTQGVHRSMGVDVQPIGLTFFGDGLGHLIQAA